MNKVIFVFIALMMFAAAGCIEKYSEIVVTKSTVLATPSPAPSPEPYASPLIPIEAAMKLQAVPEKEIEPKMVRETNLLSSEDSDGARLFAQHCARCHGEKAEGGIRVKNMGVFPKAFVTTRALGKLNETVKSLEQFSKVVERGYPGEVMPGNAELGRSEIQQIQQFLMRR